MARDLGSGAGEVHKVDAERAEEVLRFWLHEVPAEERFASDPALDRECAVRFGPLREAVIARHAAGWREHPDTLLAAIVLLDQFSRNIFRGQAEAFAADPLARSLAREALIRGWDGAMGVVERQFLYMPFMHSEAMDDQLLAARLFASQPEDVFRYAELHVAQIARYGRFPGRNAALGRASTRAEMELLSRPDARF